MKLNYFAQFLTIGLLVVTAYLAWQAGDESARTRAVVDRMAAQRQAATAQAQSAASPIPGLATPMALPSSAPTAPAPAPALPDLPKIAPAAAPPSVAPVVAAVEPTAAVPSVAIAAQGQAGSAAPAKTLIEPTPSSGAVPLSQPKIVALSPMLTPLQEKIKAALPIGKVTSVVVDQGFIVLDSGKSKGLRQGQKLAIRREASIVGEATLSMVEETESSADLDLKTVPAGVTVLAGDELIAPLAPALPNSATKE
jgi:hypothetical protein